MSWFVYILKCSDGSYYVGHTEDIKRRVTAHNAGMGAQYTAMRTPVVLVYEESATSKSFAMKRELQIKHWSKAKKNALISGDYKVLKSLARCYNVSDANQ